MAPKKTTRLMKANVLLEKSLDRERTAGKVLQRSVKNATTVPTYPAAIKRKKLRLLQDPYDWNRICLVLVSMVAVSTALWKFFPRTTQFPEVPTIGKLSDAEEFLRKTTKWMQVQLDFVNSKFEEEISDARIEMEKKFTKKNVGMQEQMRNLETQAESVDWSLKKLQAQEYATKQQTIELVNSAWKEEREEEGKRRESSIDEVRKEVRKLVEDELQVHCADGNGRVDYALESGGGDVVYHSDAYYHLYNFKMIRMILPITGRFQKHPKANRVIRPSFGEAGQCLPLKGNNVIVDVKLRTEIYLKAVTLEHLSQEVAYDVSSAPKEFTVFGWNERSDEKKRFLGEFRYVAGGNGSCIQTFDIVNDGLVNMMFIDNIVLKYQRNLLVEVDDGYLQWVLKNFPESSKAASDVREDQIYNVRTILADLKICSKRIDLQWGRKLHAKAIESGHDSNKYVETSIIRMYAKCGSMVDARHLFERIQKPDVVSWNVLILGYAENGIGLTAIELFSEMKASGILPDSVTYLAALKACTSLAGKRDGGGQDTCLKRCREIHSEVGCDLDIFVQNTLIDMYAKCGSISDARQVFDSIEKPDVVSWNALLLGYVENGDTLAALALFFKMKSSEYVPDSVTYIAALRATSLAGKGSGGEQGELLKRGRQIHLEIGCHLNTFVQNTLVDMYANCHSMFEARRVFDSIQKPDVVSWNALLMGYVENGDGGTTLELFQKMKDSGCAPDFVTYVAALKACTSFAGEQDGSWLEQGREIHFQIGRDLNIFVQNTLIDMYAKYNSMIHARRVFDSIQKPDVVSWNALLLGYVENGDGLATLGLFSKMTARGCVPNSVTSLAAIKACGLIGALARGREFHSEITEVNAYIVTCLVDFYAKCGSIIEAHEVFDAHSRERDVSTWTALLTGYGSVGDTNTVFNLFEAMQDQGFQPDSVTFVCLLSCCSHAGLVEKSREYFEKMHVQYGITPTVWHYTCMVDVLGRANQLTEAISVLRKMPCNPDVVTWRTLLGACCKWKNVEIGKCAFKSLVDMDNKDAPAYVLMAHIYGSRGLWEEKDKVLEARTKHSAWELPGQAHVYDDGHMVKFVVGEEDPADVKNKVNQFLKDMKECGYLDGTSCNAVNAKACGHTERRAVFYGIVRTSPGESVRAFKNMRMCEDCHESIKLISRLCGRVVMVRDASRFHVMVNGGCSCGDYW